MNSFFWEKMTGFLKLYTLFVENLPEGLGIDGGTTAYVQAGIIQEVEMEK
jgi:hypothetical protein